MRLRTLLPLDGLLTVTITCGLLAVSLSSKAQVTLSLANPDVTVIYPAPGSVTMDFAGTLSIDPGFFYDSAELANAYSLAGDFVPTQFGNLDFSLADNGGSVTGTMFTATVDASTPPGVYELDAFQSPAALTFTVLDGTGNPFTGTAFFSITVVDPAAAVPEGSPLVSMAALFLTGAGFLRSRLRR